jgi:endonuclease III related protein
MPSEPNDRRKTLMELYTALQREMGPSGWWPADTPFEVCIGAILTQNAPWKGVVTAIGNLKKAGLFDVHALAGADDETLAREIRPTVYHHQKARRLKEFCRFLIEEHGGSVENMRSLELHEARRRLLALHGIGFETADSILLYALGLPVFVVDAYTKRICTRHGMIDETCGYEELRRYFEDALDRSAALYNEFHALLCRLGAGYCLRTPRCGICPARAVLGSVSS